MAEIRPLTKKGDIEALVSIVMENYPADNLQECARNDLSSAFSDNPSGRPEFFLAVEDNTIVGFVGIAESFRDFSTYDIFWWNVLPSYRGEGLGWKLMKFAIEQIRAKPMARLILINTQEPTCYNAGDGFFCLTDYPAPDGHKYVIGLKVNC